VPPAVTADDAFYEFLLSRAPVRYAELKRRASVGEAVPTFVLTDVSLTFTIDVEYTVVRTQYTHNVVGIVPGNDPSLRGTYVAFGAHYDHVGHAEGAITGKGSGAPGRVTRGAADDRVWNGADDDGSGTVALMAIAKAFATSPPRPRRSLLFVWHAGEERGLWGSRYFADTASVPMDQIVSQLNLDMIGRNRNDDPAQADVVYLVGSDRLSTELHEVNRAANASLARPLRLDYEMNDPSDLEQLYYRSDHYSYAARGVPVIFFTTGLHPDYHTNTDDVSKIEFDKLSRITRLVYETGARLANLDHPPVRDRRGPRAGKGTHE
jgi:Zn-dependent M28 family amino/carboxypeptidase